MIWSCFAATWPGKLAVAETRMNSTSFGVKCEACICPAATAGLNSGHPAGPRCCIPHQINIWMGKEIPLSKTSTPVRCCNLESAENKQNPSTVKEQKQYSKETWTRMMWGWLTPTETVSKCDFVILTVTPQLQSLQAHSRVLFLIVDNSYPDLYIIYNNTNNNKTSTAEEFVHTVSSLSEVIKYCDGGAHAASHTQPKHTQTADRVLKGQRHFSTPTLWTAAEHMAGRRVRQKDWWLAANRTGPQWLTLSENQLSELNNAAINNNIIKEHFCTSLSLLRVCVRIYND